VRFAVIADRGAQERLLGLAQLGAGDEAPFAAGSLFERLPLRDLLARRPRRGERLRQLEQRARLGLAMAGGVVWLVVFLLKPVHKRQMLASSSAQFAAQMGGTRTARMEA